MNLVLLKKINFYFNQISKAEEEALLNKQNEIQLKKKKMQ